MHHQVQKALSFEISLEKESTKFNLNSHGEASSIFSELLVNV